ncbi:hypothetical protein WS70_24235 [Burkholderia mayonis]|uniref:Uncharacterized protein n=1 Tax=Burkholderia mayonis TaxID=1385591 RepID=A0A1B4FMG5_9BURK|nr:hypothetical protein [Burkholderia mayonis]AOJ04865.1 hypothetical protein WS70_24235 [Burkholderia mayonis]KVE40848.1 hypothetical protein WS70_16310 [Burkholderia mayonis]
MLGGALSPDDLAGWICLTGRQEEIEVETRGEHRRSAAPLVKLVKPLVSLVRPKRIETPKKTAQNRCARAPRSCPSHQPSPTSATRFRPPAFA